MINFDYFAAAQQSGLHSTLEGHLGPCPQVAWSRHTKYPLNGIQQCTRHCTQFPPRQRPPAPTPALPRNPDTENGTWWQFCEGGRAEFIRAQNSTIRKSNEWGGVLVGGEQCFACFRHAVCMCQDSGRHMFKCSCRVRCRDLPLSPVHRHLLGRIPGMGCYQSRVEGGGRPQNFLVRSFYNCRESNGLTGGIRASHHE